MNEPSVLDYVKALLTPWKGKPPEIPSSSGEKDAEQFELTSKEVLIPAASTANSVEGVKQRISINLPWRTGLGLLAALIAQILLTASKAQVRTAVVFYVFAGIFIVLAVIEREWVIGEISEPQAEPMPFSIRKTAIMIAAPLALLAFLAFGDKASNSNRFTTLNLILWLGGIAALAAALYLPDVSGVGIFSRVVKAVGKQGWDIRISRFSIAVLAVCVLVIFFRLFRLGQVPGEMFSDQAEKLLDVMDVLAGKTSVFFVRNTGREGFQIYLSALITMLFGTKITFLTLKIGTALAGLAALPFIYLLGKELGGKTVGLLASVMAGIAYWPNVISRIGLRFPLYPLFAAPAIYFLIRGLRYRRRNDFIWSGIALGIGLHGYSPMRWVPFVLVIILAVYILHTHARGNRQQTFLAFLGLAAVALVVFIPLLRYSISNPDMYFYRMLTRMGTAERAFPGPVGIIFLNNLWKSLVMFFYDNGNVWVNSIPGRPALDTITAVLYFIGALLLFFRYLRQRHWLDLTMLLLVPLLIMTSVLSLAFPDENPSLNRSGAAIIPVFIIAAFGFYSIVRTFLNRVSTKGAKITIGLVASAFLVISIVSNYQLVFEKYSQQYNRNIWNTSQIGEVIRDFAGSEGNLDTAYVIPYPYWVDTRLVGMNAGYPSKDYALQPDQIQTTLSETRAKLFIFNPQDAQTTSQLESLYPAGSLYRYSAGDVAKDFLMYFVPPAQP